jgi:dTDP-4-dehydrorhamnose reductase
LTRARLDLTDRRQVRKVLAALQPEAIINCAAYTMVDRAEEEPRVCRAINAEAVRYLAEAAREADCPLVQVSTDYVFGDPVMVGRPLVESDSPKPQNVYARTKLEGEQCAAKWAKHYIIRTCGLYGISPRKNNFVETMLRLSAQRDRLGVVNDQHCTPTYVAHLARAILYLLGTSRFGTYHLVNAGATTWYDFAAEIFRQARVSVRLDPITTAEFPALAARPRYSVLDISKYHALDGPRMPRWEAALAEYLAVRLLEA